MDIIRLTRRPPAVQELQHIEKRAKGQERMEMVITPPLKKAKAERRGKQERLILGFIRYDLYPEELFEAHGNEDPRAIY